MTDTEFNYRLIHWSCRCGTSPDEDRVTIGVTSFAELAATWRCPNCQDEVMARIPLKQLLADLPPPPAPSHAQRGFTKADRAWLEGAHIRLDE